MTISRSRRASSRIHRALAIVAAATTPVLAACNGPGTPATLSATSPVPTPAVSSPPTSPSAQQQVIAAILGYTSAVTAAEKSRSAGAARSLLRRYLAADRVDGMVKSMASVWSRGEMFYGEDFPHIVRVTIEGSRAYAYDCDDTSRTGVEFSATGQIVPGSTGIPDMNVITRLNLVKGSWVVQFQTVVDQPCTA